MHIFEKSSNIFNLLSEAISEGILVVNQAQIIVATNSITNEMFGYSKDELKGKPLQTLIPEIFHKTHQKHIDKYYQKKDQRRMAQGRELFGQRKNGDQFPLEIGLNPFYLYENSYVLALIRDVTSIKDKEREIRELNADLEKRIEERTHELEDTVQMLKNEIELRVEAESKIKNALEKEKELNELKTKFLSLVSHEFKTPLSGILTSATLIRKYPNTDQQDKRDKYLNTIIGEVKHLNTMLTDFLSVESLEKGKEVYRFVDFSLSKVVNEVVYSTNMLLKSGQNIRYPQNIDDITIHFDEKIVMLILNNLLYNAVKYSPEDTEIDFQIDVSNDKIIFRIIDQGIGIPKADQKHIFERYFRAENALLTQGTGIGLNIIKGHLENLGGEIHFKSEENKGSTFIVEIPLS